MPALSPESDSAQRINTALQVWRQGDLALDASWFVHVGDPENPLTETAAQAGASGIQALMSEVAGLVLVTQTCDVVRCCVARPYVEVAPLLRVERDDLQAVQRGRWPGRVTLPALIERCLVADLDRVMTIEKSILATWARTPGYELDADARAFAQALARKRASFAFPDDFVAFARKLQQRLVDKHEKSTDEGRGLRALREIRVQASPSWNASERSLFLWFIRSAEDADFEGKRWDDLLKQWLALIPAAGRFSSVEGAVVALEDMTGAEYVTSDPLDLDHLSAR